MNEGNNIKLELALWLTKARRHLQLLHYSLISPNKMSCYTFSELCCCESELSVSGETSEGAVAGEASLLNVT